MRAEISGHSLRIPVGQSRFKQRIINSRTSRSGGFAATGAGHHGHVVTAINTLRILTLPHVAGADCPLLPHAETTRCLFNTSLDQPFASGMSRKR